jgi:hypothetical protein
MIEESFASSRIEFDRVLIELHGVFVFSQHNVHSQIVGDRSFNLRPSVDQDTIVNIYQTLYSRDSHLFSITA